MDHRHRQKQLSEVKRLLLVEEFRSERIISIIRPFVFLYFTITGITQAVVHNQAIITGVIPFAAVMFVSLLLLIHNLIAGKRIRKKGAYSSLAKYFHVTVDVIIIAFINHYGTGMVRALDPTVTTGSAVIIYTVFFVLCSILYLFVNSFRFHVPASLYAGFLLAAGFCTVPFTLPAFAPVLADLSSLRGSFFLLITIVSSFVACTVLSVLLASRMRKILVKNTRQDRLKRFLPDTVVREVMAGGNDLSEDGRKVTATVLFVDIRDFTALSELLQPEEVIDLLNVFYNDMIEIVFRYRGTVDKLLGDGLLAVFGLPVSSEEDAYNAVCAAADMYRKLDSLNQVRRQAGLPQVKIGVGVHTGEVIAGSVGTERRMDYTVIGDTVNTASRLETLSKKYPGRVIISEHTRSRLPGDLFVKILGKATLRGKKLPVKIYSVDPTATPIEPEWTE